MRLPWPKTQPIEENINNVITFQRRTYKQSDFKYQKLQSNFYQQNSNLQGGVQVMCIHPWFFSIGLLHFGQGFEFAKILDII